MKSNIQDSEKKLALANALSVLKKFLTGTFVILFVGVCAFLCLLILMLFI